MNSLLPKTWAWVIIFTVTFPGTALMIVTTPIAQDIHYHAFADQRTLWGIPHFWNVISNLPFLIVGGVGIRTLLQTHAQTFPNQLKRVYLLFFTGISMVGFGSAWYHLCPENSTLLWDRLPMALAFMSLFTLVLAEFISPKTGQRAFIPLIVTGLLSVLYWAFTESQGRGDLRPYLLVQFLPMVIIPLLLIFFTKQFSRPKGYWLLFAAYVLAKICELYDQELYTLLPVSGHTLKHILAAGGTAGIIWMITPENMEKNEPLKKKDSLTFRKM